MAKVNYTKVENALNEGLLKLTVQKLLDLSEATSKDKVLLDGEYTIATLLRLLEKELIHLAKADSDIYTTLGISQTEIAGLVASANKLSAEEYKKVVKLEESLSSYIKAHHPTFSAKEDEKLIEQQRKKHINKRFNVKDTWLPLK